MIALALLAATISPPFAHSEGNTALLHLKEVPFTQVTIEDAFWAPRVETNRKVSLVHSLDMLDKFGYMTNFDLCAQGKHEGFQGLVFMDSDVYKVLESVSYSLATHPDEELSKRVDGIVARMAAAQMPDGYLDTWFQIKMPDKRFTNLRDWHELYCAGHLFEAAVAHYQATGKKNLLNIATKYADLLDRTFGDGPGKRMGYCGHPESELALVKLSRATGEKRYFDLANFFIKNRGTHFFAKEHSTPEDRYDGSYWQDDVPIAQHTKIKGHAVRAAYLMSGVVDVAGQTGDQPLLDMVNKVWRNTSERNTYVTGGIGPSAHNEGFTEDYDLPNLTAYQETCASVALAMWNHRMNLLYGDGKYADAVETALYNGMLAGVSMDGKKFFYVNPLESVGNHHRSDWFSCACCPPNVTRTLAALGNYAYSTGEDSVWFNFYVAGKGHAKVGERDLAWSVASNYPWDGEVKVKLENGGSYELRFRIPGWCEGFSAKLNETSLEGLKTDRGYFAIRRDWKAGDTIDLDLPMPVRRVAANPNVKADIGLLAVARGPLVYRAEGCDQKNALSDIWLPADAAISVSAPLAALRGARTLTAEARSGSSDWLGGLYRTCKADAPTKLMLIPYYAWDNRQAGPMKVWFPAAPPTPPSGGLERKAKVSLSHTSDNCQPWGIHDGVEPKKSNDAASALCHWWPRKGGTEWAQYDWAVPQTLEAASVFWFDDTGRGECRFPVSWKLLYLDGDAWKPVKLLGPNAGYPVEADKWCKVRFEPVTAKALRLEVVQKDGWASGVHEWKVEAAED